ncbi:MAG: hypothetical protein WDO24_20480 [Pseudomonadota bacterium]
MRVDDCPDLYRAAMLLRDRRWLGGNRAAALSVSGGNLVMLSDLGAVQDWPGRLTARRPRRRWRACCRISVVRRTRPT